MDESKIKAKFKTGILAENNIAKLKIPKKIVRCNNKTYFDPILTPSSPTLEKL